MMVWSHTCGYFARCACTRHCVGPVYLFRRCVTCLHTCFCGYLRLRVPATQCVTRIVCPSEDTLRGMGRPHSCHSRCTTFFPRTRGGAAASLSLWPRAPGPASISSAPPRVPAWEGVPVSPRASTRAPEGAADGEEGAQNSRGRGRGCYSRPRRGVLAACPAGRGLGPEGPVGALAYRPSPRGRPPPGPSAAMTRPAPRQRRHGDGGAAAWLPHRPPPSLRAWPARRRSSPDLG